MIRAPHDTPRLLPWSGADGRPCHLVGDGDGPVSRVADTIESVQPGVAGDLLDRAADLLDDQRATAAQLRFPAARLAESLRDVRRVAESRGGRLAGATAGDQGVSPSGGG